MSERLIKGMYGTEFRIESILFGLRCGQMRAERLTHNSGWYNKAGEKLGWGDLSSKDFQRVSSELNDDELFIILSEQNSHVNFILESEKSTKGLTEDAPGIKYVAKKAMYIILKNELCYVDHFSGINGLSEDPCKTQGGLQFRTINGKAAKRMIDLYSKR